MHIIIALAVIGTVSCTYTGPGWTDKPKVNCEPEGWDYKDFTGKISFSNCVNWADHTSASYISFEGMPETITEAKNYCRAPEMPSWGFKFPLSCLTSKTQIQLANCNANLPKCGAPRCSAGYLNPIMTPSGALTHTGCLTTSCKKTETVTIGATEKDAVVKKHNDLRADLASGNGAIGKNDELKVGTIKNMKEMVWSEELAFLAQKWADQCASGHDKNAQRKKVDGTYVGQNMFMKYSTASGGENAAELLKGATQSWYNEENLVTSLEPLKPFDKDTPENIGHFTQVAWSGSYEIGCGISRYHDSNQKNPYVTLVVCNYGPGGNFQSVPVYQSASTNVCDEAPHTTKLDNGLCRAV